MEAALTDGWGATVVARLGGLVDAAELPGFAAVDGDERVGLLTFAEREDGIEVVTIQAVRSGRGIGRGLMDAVRAHAVVQRAPRLWLITTNDNVQALAFYLGWGMDVRRVIRDGVQASRRAKPSIPAFGADGTPVRDEIELELVLRFADPDSRTVGGDD